MGVILRWIATVLRDWLNGYINPNWKVELDRLQRDAAAFQQQEVTVKDEIAAISEHQAATEAARVVENQRIEKSESIENVLFGK